jgi:hypothetical protein
MPHSGRNWAGRHRPARYDRDAELAPTGTIIDLLQLPLSQEIACTDQKNCPSSNLLVRWRANNSTPRPCSSAPANK